MPDGDEADDDPPDEGKPSENGTESSLSRLVRQVTANAEPLCYEQVGDTAEVARDLLEAYKARGDCLLAQAGYLDLLGRVWGCVVQGGSWVEVCVVGELDEGERCQVRVLRIDSEEVGEVFGSDGEALAAEP